MGLSIRPITALPLASLIFACRRPPYSWECCPPSAPYASSLGNVILRARHAKFRFPDCCIPKVLAVVTVLSPRRNKSTPLTV
ncbi:hypothetical protein CW304_32155 [Bacillus sp. UFRGS-B20]|nr:hypothetical protein CW304_32155 [Bacillus sp. UFRGS-B20]